MTAMTRNFDLSAPYPTTGNNRLCVGDMVVDTLRYRVWRAGRSLEIGTREFHLLRLLMSDPGRVFSREEILHRVWGDDAQVTNRNVDAYVKRLRRMLGAQERSNPIRTVRAVGYAFDENYQS